VTAAVDQLHPETVEELAIETDIRRKERPSGIGKRTDKPNWFENGGPPRHNPILLAVAAEITGKPELATIALDLGSTYLQLAMATLPDGRNYGCAANTVSAIARGHGRENHAGVTTAVLAPLLQTGLSV